MTDMRLRPGMTMDVRSGDVASWGLTRISAEMTGVKLLEVVVVVICAGRRTKCVVRNSEILCFLAIFTYADKAFAQDCHDMPFPHNTCIPSAHYLAVFLVHNMF